MTPERQAAYQVIQSQHSQFLHDALVHDDEGDLRYDSANMVKLREHESLKVSNPRWILARIVDELLDRGELTNEECDHLNNCIN